MARSQKSADIKRHGGNMNHQAALIRDALNWRYATKKFNPNRIISQEEWRILEDSLLLAPSSYGLQPWKFLIVKDPAIREKLKPVSWNQSQVTDASHYLVFTTLKTITPAYIKHFIDRHVEIRQQPRENFEGYEAMMLKNIVETMDPSYIKTWNQRQAYIAMGFLLETAALLKIDTVPMEGIDPEAYDKILGIDQSEYGTVASVALGYRADDDKYQMATKVRFAKEQIIQTI
jgi:nitroreductase